MSAPAAPEPDPDWEAVKAAYRAGESAASVARRFGLPAHRVQRRARRYSWRGGAAAPSPDPTRAASAALADAARAVAEGRISDAEALARLAERLTKTAAALNALSRQAQHDNEEEDARTTEDIREALEERLRRIAEAQGLTE